MLPLLLLLLLMLMVPLMVLLLMVPMYPNRTAARQDQRRTMKARQDQRPDGVDLRKLAQRRRGPKTWGKATLVWQRNRESVGRQEG